MKWNKCLTLQGFIVFMIIFHLLSIIVIFNRNLSALPNVDRRELSQLSQESQGSYESLEFTDPVTAYYVLEKLDIFSQINVTEDELSTSFKNPNMGWRNDNDYCKKHRAFFVNHPEAIFEEKNILVSAVPNSIQRKDVIPAIGTDLVTATRSWAKKPFDLSLNMTSIFTMMQLHYGSAIGIHYACLSQVVNVLPGNPYIYRKDYAAELIVNYAKRYETRPQCFDYEKFFPKTWVLYKEDQCREFFNTINNSTYQQLKKERGGIVYIRKIGSGAHQGKGVFPINNDEEKYIRNLYKDGQNCGKIDKNNIIQYYIWNPLLLNGRKCDFRTYMLVASANPIIGYYRDGFLRVSLRGYDPNTKEKSALLTNTAQAKSTFRIAAQNGTFEGKDMQQLIQDHQWTYKRLQDYLLQVGLIQDTNWLDNYLRPEMRRAMAHLIRMSQHHFMKKSQLYQLFGVDFMLDSDLKLWFIEANRGPGFGYKEDPEEIYQGDIQMLTDQFEIVYNLMRSRMKRVVQYVNSLIKDGEVVKLSGSKVFIRDVEEKREEFKKLTMNSYEPEFRISSTNSFQPIVDENYEGSARYFDLFDEKCV